MIWCKRAWFVASYCELNSDEGVGLSVLAGICFGFALLLTIELMLGLVQQISLLCSFSFVMDHK